MSIPYIEIVPNTNAAIQLLRQLSITTFTDTFAEQNTKEDMDAYLISHLSFEQLQLEIDNPNSRFYFLKEGENAIGYLKLNCGDAQTAIKDTNALEIERIYVLKEYFGKNFGKMMLDKAIKIATEKQLNFIWLGVWEKNLRAIRFYEKNGFYPFDSHVFVLGKDEQTDVLMKLVINTSVNQN